MGVEMVDDANRGVTGGELILQRLERKACIKCGLRPALDWPYICRDCEKELNEQRKLRDAS